MSYFPVPLKRRLSYSLFRYLTGDISPVQVPVVRPPSVCPSRWLNVRCQNRSFTELRLIKSPRDGELVPGFSIKKGFFRPCLNTVCVLHKADEFVLLYTKDHLNGSTLLRMFHINWALAVPEIRIGAQKGALPRAGARQLCRTGRCGRKCKGPRIT